jgi:hypothetical protein
MQIFIQSGVKSATKHNSKCLIIYKDSCLIGDAGVIHLSKVKWDHLIIVHLAFNPLTCYCFKHLIRMSINDYYSSNDLAINSIPHWMILDLLLLESNFYHLYLSSNSLNTKIISIVLAESTP